MNSFNFLSELTHSSYVFEALTLVQIFAVLRRLQPKSFVKDGNSSELSIRTLEIIM
jgi:hypothetical protein